MRPAPLDEVCSGGYHARSCNASPTEQCCGRALCRDCYVEHLRECDELADTVRRDLYPDGCDCATRAGEVCLTHRRVVEDEIRRRAGEVTP